MDRKDFLTKAATLGIGLPFLAQLLTSCEKEDLLRDQWHVSFSGKVLVIGAGAAGLTAGYILDRYNVDFEIIEASAVHGGRVKKIDGFADFPIDLGAEWIHTAPSVLAGLLDDPDSNASVDTIVYNPQTISYWNGSKLKRANIGRHFYSEYKFKNTTWYDFFDQYMVPKIADRIRYNSPVTRIDSSAGKVVVTTAGNVTYEADKVLITVPTAVLKSGAIEFVPALPAAKTNAIDQMYVPAGIKVFIEFSERFYPDIVLGASLGEYLGAEDTERTFYDATFRKDSGRHVLGLFTIGRWAEPYTTLGSDQEVVDKVLAELDEMFDGKASQTYVKHVVQNWSAEPYILGSYTHFTGSEAAAQDAMLTPIENKLYFAGEALHPTDSATVHGAAQTAYNVLETLLQS